MESAPRGAVHRADQEPTHLEPRRGSRVLANRAVGGSLELAGDRLSGEPANAAARHAGKRRLHDERAQVDRGPGRSRDHRAGLPPATISGTIVSCAPSITPASWS